MAIDRLANSDSIPILCSNDCLEMRWHILNNCFPLEDASLEDSVNCLEGLDKSLRSSVTNSDERTINVVELRSAIRLITTMIKAAQEDNGGNRPIADSIKLLLDTFLPIDATILGAERWLGYKIVAKELRDIYNAQLTANRGGFEELLRGSELLRNALIARGIDEGYIIDHPSMLCFNTTEARKTSLSSWRCCDLLRLASDPSVARISFQSIHQEIEYEHLKSKVLDVNQYSQRFNEQQLSNIIHTLRRLTRTWYFTGLDESSKRSVITELEELVSGDKNHILSAEELFYELKTRLQVPLMRQDAEKHDTSSSSQETMSLNDYDLHSLDLGSKENLLICYVDELKSYKVLGWFRRYHERVEFLSHPFTIRFALDDINVGNQLAFLEFEHGRDAFGFCRSFERIKRQHAEEHV